MRVSLGFVLWLSQVLAQSFTYTDLASYLSLSPVQSQLLQGAASDVGTYTTSQQTRLDQLHQLINDARNGPAPDATAIGQYYVEYETILRQAAARADQWHAAALGFLSSDQLALIGKLERASQLASLSTSSVLAGLSLPAQSSPPTSAFEQSAQTYIDPYFVSGLQQYLGLTDAQLAALTQLVSRYTMDSTRIANQITQASLDVQLELTKDTPDPAAVGQLITQMDASVVSQPATAAQLRDQLLAQLTANQKQALQVLDEAAKLWPLTQTATCYGLVRSPFVAGAVVSNGGVIFNVNFPPHLSIGCNAFGF